jgi:large subunit ribosomal protein L17
VRHRNLSTKVRGTSTHNRAMYSNMLLGLVEHGRIQTTERRARVLRSLAEKMVTRATRLGDLLLKDKSKLDAADKARLVHAMRMVRRDLKQREAVIRLFEEVAPKYLGRPGGYTRIYKTGFRKGDGAPMALLEFVDAEMPARETSRAPEAEKTEKKGRIASLLGGKKKAKAAAEPAPEGKGKSKRAKKDKKGEQE